LAGSEVELFDMTGADSRSNSYKEEINSSCCGIYIRWSQTCPHNHIYSWQLRALICTNMLQIKSNRFKGTPVLKVNFQSTGMVKMPQINLLVWRDFCGTCF